MKQSIWEYESKSELRDLVQNKRVVLAGGCFDLIHYGHFTFLNLARAEGEVLIVALESDAHIETYKSRKPIHTQHERAEILAGLKCVDHVILLPSFNSDEEYAELVRSMQPAVIAVSAPDPKISKKMQHAKIVGAVVVEVTPVIPQLGTRSILDQN